MLNLNNLKVNVTREVITYKGIEITLINNNTVTIRAEFTINGAKHIAAGEITAKTKIDKLLHA